VTEQPAATEAVALLNAAGSARLLRRLEVEMEILVVFTVRNEKIVEMKIFMRKPSKPPGCGGHTCSISA
jgi:hypothetical protein